MAAPGTNTNQNGRESEYTMGDMIGEGSSFDVYEVSCRNPRGGKPLIYALKTLQPKRREFEDGKKAFENEVRILSAAQQYHVVEYIDHFIGDTNSLNLVMERATGALSQYLDRKDRVCTEWFVCLANVVNHIHKKGIRHRDIKPQNILLQGNTILLADFGISTVTLGPTMPTTIPNYARGRTKEYCAPEVEEGSTRGRAGDIFSLGAVFLKMFVTSYYPTYVSGLEQLLEYKNPANRNDAYPSFANTIDKVYDFIQTLRPTSQPRPRWNDGFVDLCIWMLQKDRDHRPESKQVLQRLPELDPSAFQVTQGGRCICMEDPELTLVDACQLGLRNEANALLAKELKDNRSFLESNPEPIHQASANGHEEIVQDLIRGCVRPDKLMKLECYSGQTALHCAASCKDEHVSLVNLLLNNGANAMAEDVEGRTALHYAAGQGHSGIVRALLSRQRRPDRNTPPNLASVRDRDSGHTALHIAAKRGHAKVVKVLLEEFKLPPGQATKKGFCPLHFAAGCGSFEVAELLIKNGAAIDVQDQDGCTPLHWAADGRPGSEQDYAQMFKLLIENGANVETRDLLGTLRGRTPQDYARSMIRERNLEEAQRQFASRYVRRPIR
jgi:serine/threonine protein kinase